MHGDYARTQRLGITVTLLLVETFGGYGPELLALLRDAAAFKDNNTFRNPQQFGQLLHR